MTNMTRADIPLDFRNTNTLWCSVLVETLVRLGVRHAVISPGSRSAPLTFAFVRNKGIAALPVLDERSAGFFALGLAKSTRRPVALICTSGTAAANFLPAVVEAHETGVPLLVFTADRPPELRDCHAGQAINQHRLYGTFAAFIEMAIPGATVRQLHALRQTVVRAHALTARPMSGPVHLNCPYRDPLPPLAQTLPAGITTKAFRGFFAGLNDEWPPGRPLARPRGPVRFPEKTDGIIVVGPNEPTSPESFVQNIGRLSRALGWPVLADALSPVRMHGDAGGHVVAHYDAILRGEKTATALLPQHVICIGGWPTSKVLRAWLQRADPKTVLLTDRTDNMDGLHLRTTFVRGGFGAWCGAFRGRKAASAYTQRWLAEEARVALALELGLAGPKRLVEPAVVPVLAKHLPQRTSLFVASSMPVRDLEYIWPKCVGGQRVRFNRGANGIDGTLSTALGLAHGDRQPAVLLTGDLALLHDTNGFLSVAKFKGSLTIVLINNNGGGIFEHLPVARFDPPFEEFFATPQNIDFHKLCATYGVAHVVVKNLVHLARLVAKLPKAGVRVLEVRTDRKRDAAFRRELFARVANG
jgi:2-succinyl-5-enolpyruvyl-6-hydroxy-3-cyclohexene-1-carboxylate synthase